VLEREVAAGGTLEQGIKIANVEVFEAVERELGRPGMASTVVALLFDGSAWVLAWVGDSRAYLWDGQLGLLSRDHSLVESLVRTGQITLEEAREHPKKNVIEQAIGLQGEDNLRIGSNYGELQPGQLMLLCSDGLNDVLDSASIVEILEAGGSIEERGQALVKAAVESGGRDNTTVVILEAANGDVVNDPVREPEFVWRYDPVSKSYSGLPELKPRPRAAVKRVAPRAPEGTVMMRAPLVPGGAMREVRTQERKSRNTRYLWAAIAVAVLAVIAGGLMMADIF
jgi:protein phosphatase